LRIELAKSGVILYIYSPNCPVVSRLRPSGFGGQALQKPLREMMPRGVTLRLPAYALRALAGRRSGLRADTR